jgi:hypothetical protein
MPRVTDLCRGSLEVLAGLQHHTTSYESRKGVYCPTNTIYWIEKWQKGPASTTIITNLADSGKKKVKKVTVAVESAFLHRLVRGKDISRWSWASKYKIILPQEPDQPSKAVLESTLKVKFPKTFDYFKQFEGAIRKCALLAQFFNPDVDPFYSSYNVGSYTYAPFKVVWKEICAEIEAVVIASGEETIIPDHKLVLVSFHSEDPAYFLSGMLNSSPIGLFVRSYTLQTSISGHIFDYVAIPEYSAKDALHSKVVELSKKCHEAKTSGKASQLNSLEEKLDECVAEVLKVPKAKLEIIRDELQLLRGNAPDTSEDED